MIIKEDELAIAAPKYPKTGINTMFKITLMTMMNMEIYMKSFSLPVICNSIATGPEYELTSCPINNIANAEDPSINSSPKKDKNNFAFKIKMTKIKIAPKPSILDIFDTKFFKDSYSPSELSLAIFGEITAFTVVRKIAEKNPILNATL